jgi:DNA-binding LacI/PurR family transcriptional regulator
VWTHALSYPVAEERGVKAAAEALGYRVDVIKPWTLGGGKGDISRMLWSRGIRGVLLAPNYSRPDPRYDLDWPRFCTVLLGSSLVNQGLTRVSRDYYHDATLALDQLRKHGCQRPGIVLESNFYERSGRRCVAAFLAFGGSRKHTHVFKVRDDLNRDAVLRWYEQTKPDGVVVAAPPIAGWLSHAPMLALLNQPCETAGTGVQVNFEQIGMEGMHALNALLRTDRRGLLPNPTSILVPGRWVENGCIIPTSASVLSHK